MDQALIPFDNSYARLPERFFTRMNPEPVKAPSLVKLNAELASELGFRAQELGSEEAVEWLSGNRVPAGAEPIAAVYAGHQFGGWSPRLGDGRAILLGEVVGKDGVRRDIQLKGSGQTPYSRSGDGRAAVGPVLREYLISEAMHALGVPTTRALAAVTTGQHVIRDTVLPGAILTRVAESHIRVGTFQYFASQQDYDAIRALADFSIARHDPEAADAENPYLTFFAGVVERQANLIAQWLSIGFIHGVMNTDNMTISGETIDYGPCAFMDHYNPEQVYSSIDHYGRYAFSNQPTIAQWNLVQLAQCLLPIIDQDREHAVELAQAVVDEFPTLFQAALANRMTRKLGIAAPEPEDAQLVQELLDLMAKERADFTLTFRFLTDTVSGGTDHEPPVGAITTFREWMTRWQARLDEQDTDPAAVMSKVNPIYIPRNHRVEEALDAATRDASYEPFERLLNVITNPFEHQNDCEDFVTPPEPDEIVPATFCGT
ncbi:MAG: YdiU family protein [Pseudomonadota bacterium]